jgi:hypothetical protein
MRTLTDHRVLSMAEASQLYRAMNGDQEAQKIVTLQDLEGLQNAPTFERFLLWNKELLETYEDQEEAIERAR